MKLGKILFAGGVVAAIAHFSKRKTKRSSSTRSGSGGGVVIDEDPVIDEVVPPPSDATHIFWGEEMSPRIEAEVQYWVSEYDGKFGWQYVVKGAEDGDGEMSYLDGIIYHYDDPQVATDDLMSIIR